MWIRILTRKENKEGGNKTRFQITTDYAIRMVVYLVQRWPRSANSLEMEAKLGISHNYVHKVTSRLRKAGLIESTQGPYGGYRLAKEPGDISLYDVIRTTEGELCITTA